MWCLKQSQSDDFLAPVNQMRPRNWRDHWLNSQEILKGRKNRERTVKSMGAKKMNVPLISCYCAYIVLNLLYKCAA